MAVEVITSARDMELTPRLRNYIDKKVGKLDRYIESITEARVEISHIKSARSSGDRHVAQLTVRGKGGMLLRAEERSDDVFASIDAALDKIHRQIERFKGKHWSRRGDGAGAETLAMPDPPEEVEAALAPQIVRRKRFPLTPMDEGEAVEQMAMLGHDNFFVFYNVNTDAVNVLYRRRDGQFGLIEPEFD